ncbi:g3305 [Coccomyxa viridis]|uniref:G3305 protein n=1 Tax=Coccomyxa viridis TaxID=1274662 RepID=A0ABP1FMI3_9CHLO
MARYGSLEVFKFGCYLSIPVLMTVFVAGNPGRLEAIIKNRAYVVYPPEGPRPPTAEELIDRINKNKR